jgi:glycosyltransferase involved in cell wall biosynthesis
MKILVLTKRQYSGYDLLDHRFGRIRELPLALARLGHCVMGIAFSYRRSDEQVISDSDPSGNINVTWHSINLRSGLMPRFSRYEERAIDIANQFGPDVIWACSDAYHAIFGTRLADKLGVHCIVDLYDNFESFKATRLPGVLPRFKRAVQSADGVTCISGTLENYIIRNYGRKEPIFVLPNAARTDLFSARDRRACRRQLGLPEQAIIIGTAGALDKSRGVNALFRAFELLLAKKPELHLALAGPRSRFSKIPLEPMVHDLGTLPLEIVPVLLNALDVAVICNRDSAFGRYCFPQKAYEIIACRVPPVAAAVGSMKELLAEYPACLYEPENANSLAQAIERQLVKKIIVDLQAPSWTELAKNLEVFFRTIAGVRSTELSSTRSCESLGA